ncbi:MAG: tripartite tricarboxylate transporter substrate binding protein [Proteobacteria bacterium]|nr:tripartite tricarboxylate transporter substrate binding protein [Burkholderiales bacterium]
MNRLLVLLLAAPIATVATCALAQGYPAKPVRLILAYPPGGATDTLGRIIGKALSETWGQSVIADNRPGASGSIGTTLCVKSPPDGYTMCTVSVAQSTASRMSANAGFDSLKDFSHVSLIATMPMMLLVHPSLPVKNVAQLVTLARKNPGALSYASSGGGAGPHLAAELFKQLAGIDILSVTYKGAGAQLTDQLAGRVEVAFAPAVGFVSFVKEGKLRALAVSTRQRFPLFPDVPSISESGIPKYDASSWQGLSMPAGVPRDIVNRVSADANRALKTPAIRDRILELGGIAGGNTPEEFSAFFQTESDKWYQVARAAKVVTE